MTHRLDTVLAATDFSREAEAALRRAAALAYAHGAALEVLHVLAHTLAGDTWQLLADYWRSRLAGTGADRARQIALGRLEATAARLSSETGRPAQTHLAEGRPPVEIAARAAALGAGLVAVGAHGEHGMRELFLGSTAQQLLRLAPCPVLMVRQWPLAPYERVLLPTDFSAPAREAARLARDFFPGARPCLFHAFELPYEPMMRYAGVESDTIETHRREAQARLREELAAFAESAGFARHEALLRVAHGYAPARILEAAQDMETDLIVIATHGRSGLEAAFLGSVALRIALEARCDVLFVRPQPAAGSSAAAGAPVSDAS
jgi:nucleotide-binding universal stress UspA family protein